MALGSKHAPNYILRSKHNDDDSISPSTSPILLITLFRDSQRLLLKSSKHYTSSPATTNIGISIMAFSTYIKLFLFFVMASSILRLFEVSKAVNDLYGKDAIPKHERETIGKHMVYVAIYIWLLLLVQSWTKDTKATKDTKKEGKKVVEEVTGSEIEVVKQDIEALVGGDGKEEKSALMVNGGDAGEVLEAGDGYH
jgi:hypothetical protein